MYEQYIQDELDDLGIEAELVDIETVPEHETAEIEPGLETREVVRIVPYKPGEGNRQNRVYNYVTPDGEQFAFTVKERPQCPSCDYILSGEEEQKHPARCSEDSCQNWTCPACKTICDACTNTLCDQHSYGHGVKDGSYCSDDYLDVDEQVKHERQLEKQEQNHREKLELLEKRRQMAKEKREQDRQDRKLESEIKRKKAEIAIQIVQQLQQQQDTSGYPELPEEVQRIQQLTQGK